ncbi:MAG: DnaJ domain-containing protein [bacterium]|nr:DnaJ domain-containing protein [bacterium]
MSSDSTDSEITKAYRMQALIYHPDKARSGHESEATEKMKQINLAHASIKHHREHGRSIPIEPQRNPQRAENNPYARERRDISFEEASADAGIPEDIEWVLSTDNLHESRDSDTHYRSSVIIGKKQDTLYVAGILHITEYANLGRHFNANRWHMHLKTLPIDNTRDLTKRLKHAIQHAHGITVASIPSLVRKTLPSFLYTLKNATWNASIRADSGNKMSIDMALFKAGIIDTMPEVKVTKVKLDIKSPQENWKGESSGVTILIVNNTYDFSLSSESTKRFASRNFSRVLGIISYENNYLKTITSIRDKHQRKQILTFIINVLKENNEDERLIYFVEMAIRASD